MPHKKSRKQQLRRKRTVVQMSDRDFTETEDRCKERRKKAPITGHSRTCVFQCVVLCVFVVLCCGSLASKPPPEVETALISMMRYEGVTIGSCRLKNPQKLHRDSNRDLCNLQEEASQWDVLPPVVGRRAPSLDSFVWRRG